ncbi:MAG: DNA polymerase III subunit [Lachnospiraceae bacterium]|jgi:DNA polymerase-3 subunit delta'|nr:DNA polymerase III subunit [Lachnospiraceae bacterium]MEE3461585.1 DNA polymerase III subunit [Lachnospiraceae bacterium]
MADFKDIIGQKDIIRNLKSSIATGRFSHAYIINGETGSGRLMLAEAFARTLLCSGNKEAKEAVKKVIESGTLSEQDSHQLMDSLDACDICTSCRKADTNSNPDIIHVTHSKASISVADIREQIIGTIDYQPYENEYKVYIVDDAPKMTAEAQNALLKTLEEPPAYAVIILLSDSPEKLLDTIKSRCLMINTKPISRTEIRNYLEKTLKMDPQDADIAANFCQGNVGRAIRFATSEDFGAMKDQVLDLLKNINEMDIAAIIERIKIFTADRKNIDDYLDLMLLWFRDVLMFKATKDANLMLYSEEYTAISKEASRRSYEELESIIESIKTTKKRLKANVNYDTAMELLVMNIKDPIVK